MAATKRRLETLLTDEDFMTFEEALLAAAAQLVAEKAAARPPVAITIDRCPAGQEIDRSAFCYVHPIDSVPIGTHAIRHFFLDATVAVLAQGAPGQPIHYELTTDQGREAIVLGTLLKTPADAHQA